MASRKTHARAAEHRRRNSAPLENRRSGSTRTAPREIARNYARRTVIIHNWCVHLGHHLFGNRLLLCEDVPDLRRRLNLRCLAWEAQLLLLMDAADVHLYIP